MTTFVITTHLLLTCVLCPLLRDLYVNSDSVDYLLLNHYRIINPAKLDDCSPPILSRSRLKYAKSILINH